MTIEYKKTKLTGDKLSKEIRDQLEMLIGAVNAEMKCKDVKAKVKQLKKEQIEAFEKFIQESTVDVKEPTAADAAK